VVVRSGSRQPEEQRRSVTLAIHDAHHEVVVELAEVIEDRVLVVDHRGGGRPAVAHHPQRRLAHDRARHAPALLVAHDDRIDVVLGVERLAGPLHRHERCLSGMPGTQRAALPLAEHERDVDRLELVVELEERLGRGAAVGVDELVKGRGCAHGSALGGRGDDAALCDFTYIVPHPLSFSRKYTTTMAIAQVMAQTALARRVSRSEA
jgi:hypothetical protein